MEFLQYPNLVGKHAFLSPSQARWINYNDDKLIRSYTTATARQKGTELHEFAAKAIEHGIKLADNGETINIYVNDCIDNDMKPEQVLYYNEHCFGTADAISFENGVLKIFDLKTGVVVKAKFIQLIVYAALFCLAYNIEPGSIKIELRIYQFNEYREYYPTTDEVLHVIDRIMISSDVLDRYLEKKGAIKYDIEK